MSKSAPTRKRERVQGITRIAVSGYKSLYEECSIEVRPLTILAGVNSSGKSSIMQPLLLLKQTLEATYDPGPLLLDGPHVRFTLTEQLFSHISPKIDRNNLIFKIKLSDERELINKITKNLNKIEISQTEYAILGEYLILKTQITPEELEQILSQIRKNGLTMIPDDSELWRIVKLMPIKNRCFVDLGFLLLQSFMPQNWINLINLAEPFKKSILQLIHVPGLRGNPERTYKTTAVEGEFPGTFENYVASIVNYWKEKKDPRLAKLGSMLATLGLTWKVDAKQIDDTQVELLVGRLPRSSKGGARDMVSIADVGFGVSQVLPVLVALLVAEPGQLVYLEQPEIHLHPKAQAALAEILAEAANREVRVVVETHSDLLLRRVQSLVAEGTISPEKVKLHWFERQENGMTVVKSADLDEAGAFGEWPADFADVAIAEESRYLDAAESRLAEKFHAS
ncbi:MAG TPA: AAA family ATPase [Oscillatoriaceae cyanobacterium M33_DOE_052]|uniref:DUF3696 domain-containing protein n=1 Tax=Planktothricoides sp. SpSt-374 TaxID=2282167 RepID=A0A7C3ZMY9_9CYAN|nr:AAA family ATPase [Oscillatoriaceae cyanobacterium M33_DOE_052]